MKMSLAALSLIAGMLLPGCMTAKDHAKTLHSTEERELTTGIVQKEIRAGMSQGDVAVALGSPNIVNRDDTGRETWIYDRIATEASYSQSSLAGGILLIGGSRETGATAVTQKSLTVVIKFDEKGTVESTRFHSSRF